MRYFELLNLRREPFSNSPDPELFYRAKEHRECLQALEIAIRLKRGLSVVTGHVGTGKTTLCRQLIRVLSDRQGVVTHLVLDPYFSDAREFLTHLNGLFGVDAAEARTASDWQLRENIKNALLTLAVEEDRLVVLIVDEGQKMSLECLEILRELLNFETNEHKLLQIVIFGQLEFEPILEAKANLADRVNLRFRLGPLDFQDTRELIQARIAMCSKDISPEGLFSFWAFLAVYLATDGFPRQIVQLCHQALLAVIIKERPRVTWGVVRSCMRWRTLGLPRRRRWPWLAGAALFLLLALAGAGVYFGYAPVSAERLKVAASWMKDVKLPDVGSWFAKAPAVEMQSSAPQTPDGSSGTPAAAGATSGHSPEAMADPGHQTLNSARTAAKPSPSVPPAPVAQSAPQPAPAAPEQSQAAAPQPDPVQPAQDVAPAQEGTDPAKQQADATQPARESGPPRFTGVRASAQDGDESLDILTSRPVDRFEVSFKPNPSRILVDLMGAWERRADRELPVGTVRLDKVRTAVQPDRLRVAVYLKDASAGPFQPTVEKTPLGLRIILK
ncbi:MAG: AAA family ATPase [Acidobacteriota bacterium]